jgi:hypothetical protein
MICVVLHREDLHARNYQYANESLSRDEARRIAKGISRLPELMKRPPTREPTGRIGVISFYLRCER